MDLTHQSKVEMSCSFFLTSMNVQIATAAEELNATVNEVDRNMININDVAESNSEDARSLSDVGVRLSALSNEIQAQVSKFKV